MPSKVRDFSLCRPKLATLYTRNGGFRVSAAGQLVSASFDPVLGAASPITIPNGELAISTDGMVSVNGALVGKLQISKFAADTRLEPAGESYYSAPDKAAHPAISSSVRQGTLESSNVSPVTAMVSLISAQRQVEMMERAMGAFYSDFNRIAADDLPKV